jgi:glycosyltransferase involved in cell wall biosynthesis
VIGKRVLVLTSNFPRWQGDPTTPFVLHLAQDLQNLGWDLEVLAPGAPGAASHEILDGIPVSRFRYLWPEKAQTVCYDGGALVNLRNNPRERIKLPMLVAAEWFSTTRRLATRQFDLLHSHWILPQGFVGVMSARPTRTPHVTTVHGGDVFSLRSAALKPFKRTALRASDAITVNSSATAALVADIAGPETPVERIAMGTDVSPPDPTLSGEIRDRHRDDDGPLLVFVGRLVSEKGVFDLLDAVRLIRADLPGVSALIVGEGPSRDTLEEYAVTIGVSDRVHFTGWISPAHVVAHMAAGDVVVGPSKMGEDGWVEALGLTMVEAMASGSPLVASRIGGIPDVVIDGETGILIEPGSPPAIAAAVRWLINHPADAKRIGAAGQRRARDLFSREASAQAFSDLFVRVLKQRSPAST